MDGGWQQIIISEKQNKSWLRYAENIYLEMDGLPLSLCIIFWTRTREKVFFVYIDLKRFVFAAVRKIANADIAHIHVLTISMYRKSFTMYIQQIGTACPISVILQRIF